MIWLLYTLAIAVVSFYIGAAMATGRRNPWRSAGKRRADD